MDASSDSGTIGDRLTNRAVVDLLGVTGANQALQIDVDGDGFDDGTVTADGNGNFRISNIALQEGSNTVRARATNDQGTVIGEITLLLDTRAPEGTLIAPAPNSLTNQDLGYVAVQWQDVGDAGLDASSFDPNDVTVTGVTVDRAEHLGNGLVRYWYRDDGDKLPDGSIRVEQQSGQVRDKATNQNTSRSDTFTVDSQTPTGTLVFPAPQSLINQQLGIYRDPVGGSRTSGTEFGDLRRRRYRRYRCHRGSRSGPG